MTGKTISPLRQRMERLQRCACALARSEGRGSKDGAIRSRNHSSLAPSKINHQPTDVGRQVFWGCRQSIPESRYPSWTGEIDIAPSAGLGHRKRPFSNRLVNRHAPWPSCQITFKRSPLRPRKQNRCPLSGSRRSTSWTCNDNDGKPLLISGWPVASHTRTPVGTGIIGHPKHSESASRHPDRRRHRSAQAGYSQARSRCDHQSALLQRMDKATSPHSPLARPK